MKSSQRQLLDQAGLAPGTLIYVGEKDNLPVRISLTRYNKKQLKECVGASVEDCLKPREPDTVHWIDVHSLSNVATIEEIGRHFGLHPLTLEDLLNTQQRPKIEVYDGYIFIVLKMIYLKDPSRELVFEHLSVILGQDFVLTFQEQPGDVFGPVRSRLRNESTRLRQHPSDFLAYALFDAVVDHYFVVLESLGERVEELESQLLSNPNKNLLAELMELKKTMIRLRRAVWPAREIAMGLERSDSCLVRRETVIYIRDVYDHSVQVMDAVESIREMLSGMIEIYLSSLSNRMNDIMRILTVLTTIFMPLTFIAGVYGMNFEFMPELKWEWGYPLAWVVMLLIGAARLLFFRRKKWL